VSATPGAIGGSSGVAVPAVERGRRRRRGRRPAVSAALHLGLLGAVLIAIFPVLWIVLSSFKHANDINPPRLQILPPDWTAANYRHVLSGNDHIFLHWLANSLIIAFFTTVVGIFVAATAAYAFSRYRFPGYRPALTSFLITQMFPGAILLVPIYNIIVKLDLLNTKTALVLAYSTVAVPFCVWMLKGYFDTIPISLEEAGRIDGLTPFGTFWRIVIPLSLPGLIVTGFYTFLTAWNEVMFANVFLTSEKNYTLPIGLRVYVNQFEIHYENLTAGAVLVTIPAIVVFLIAQRYLISGLTRGGVKG
jgi:arabinogalactan oligomer / maltooligosaccharide transport system permease protein